MTSVEDQECAEQRIPELTRTPSVVRGLSVEPLLGPVDVQPWLEHIHWIIVGGESGRKARPINPEWVESICTQCHDAGVAFFFKQWGEWAPITNEDEPIFDGFADAFTSYTVPMQRVGKKAAGRLFKGQLWNELPYVEALA